MRYSFVIPVYNRPDEVRELLESLTHQELFDFEIVIIEDGSSVSSEAIVESYRGSFPALRYIAVPNGGPSRARNLGAREATGEYLIILDSDVVLPPGYLTAVDDYLEKHPVDAFGGPDAASDDFTTVQKAINYAMTSPLTTGGIRGGSADGMEKFKPRTSTSVVAAPSTYSLEDSMKRCASARILTSAFASSREGIARHSSKKPSCTTSAEWTSASSSSRSITQVSHVSTWRRAILGAHD